MKKIMALLLASLSLSAAAAEYPAICVEMEELNRKMIEMSPKLKKDFDAKAYAAELESNREEFAKASKDEQKKTAQLCRQAVTILKQSLEMKNK